ncbi:hypothetical protein SI65_10022 [Aspergillus cristatus]|uniref:BZIP domain-containing protein n=1 Tax=Aspergillus cristatus TaxID=573508 RepID=A0A1E3B222_ASPCR|nr:hypothetical protein SI65_10022 [Aspergillus cristatus]
MHSEIVPNRSDTTAATAKTEPTDDAWSGLTDPVERRRRQNRLNQRARRQRKRAQEDPYTRPSTTIIKTSPQSTSPPDTAKSTDTAESTENAVSPVSSASSTSRRRCLGLQTLSYLHKFSESAYQSYILGCPTSDHLLTLSKVNVFRAFEAIMASMGMTPYPEWMHDDAISPFSTLRPGIAEDTNLPLALRPTKLQKSLAHHPWLDFFPLPKMRDNLLRAGEFDDEELCVDIMGFWDMSTDSCSMLVWGEPTDPSSWEVTEAFLKKWPWVVRGCPELLQSTNYWRRKRGDAVIFRYI